ncbi:MAG TPA: DUF4860 domain-containing protein [Oscillospiraceae bacterium]|nr:DUF4860 domain-containing protein [Oscillospiraceae bacterium]
MMRRRSGSLNTAAVLSLCAAFFLLAMGLAVMASGVYRSVVSASDLDYTRRTALGYLVNQIRRGDVAEGVAVGSFGGVDAIFLTQDEAGSRYTTCLYCYEGELRELYVDASLLGDFSPSDGIAVLPLSSLSVRLSDGVVNLEAEDEDGVRSSVSVAPRCGVWEAGS